MFQSYIIITQSFVDAENLKKAISEAFFVNQDQFLEALNYADKAKSDELWQHYLSKNQIINFDIQNKSDFSEEMLGLYQNYAEPSLLFLGDLSSYSTALQEGMLRLLEEPPKNLYIILFSRNSQEVLPTIQSRCKIYNLPNQIVMQNLNQDLLSKVKKGLPPVQEFAKNLLDTDAPLPDVSKVDREELEFWLWQVLCYLQEYYKAKPNYKVAKKIFSLITALNLNQQNVQKKLALGWVNI